MCLEDLQLVYSAIDLLLEELALTSTHPENTDEGRGSNPDGEVMSETKKTKNIFC